MSMTFDQWLQNNRGLLGTGCTLSPEDRLRAAWHAGQSQCASGEWRPIGAAPKDGTVVFATGLGWDLGQMATYCDDHWEHPCCGTTCEPTHFARLHEVQP